MSIMFSGVDRALKNMDVNRHMEIVNAIAVGDGDVAAAAVVGAHGRRRNSFGCLRRPRALDDNPLAAARHWSGQYVLIAAPRHCQT